ncbi:MAG: replication-relaxation family protein [Patescibacteria group bacterium]
MENINNSDLSRILDLIDSHPFLSSQNISDYFNIDLRKVRRVVYILYKDNLLDFITKPIFFVNSNVRYFYTTKKGHSIVGSSGSRSSGSKSSGSKSQESGSKDRYIKADKDIIQLYLNHNVEANNFFLRLKKYSIDNNLEFEDWVSDLNLIFKFKYNNRSYILKPDGFCILGRDNIFLELDMATESSFRIFEKIDNYSSFYLSYEYLRYFKKNPFVIFLTTDLYREKFLRDKVSYFMNTKKYKDELNFFKFINFKDFHRDPSIVL